MMALGMVEGFMVVFIILPKDCAIQLFHVYLVKKGWFFQNIFRMWLALAKLLWCFKPDCAAKFALFIVGNRD